MFTYSYTAITKIVSLENFGDLFNIWNTLWNISKKPLKFFINRNLVKKRVK